MTNANIVIIALVPLIMYRIYKRVQRLTVRQKSRMWRHWASVVLFPLLLTILAVMLTMAPLALAALAGGVAGGTALGIVALRRTGFERIGSDYFYTPYAPIGLMVSMLFIARAMYRVYEMTVIGMQQTPNIGHSPLTMGIFGIMAGYYVTYGIGLLRWRSAERALQGRA
jgi:hypothetical protein